jgi:MFS family permease
VPSTGQVGIEGSQDASWWTLRRRNYVLFILCLIGIINFIDRQILAILLEPIKADLQVSDSLMGLLSGLAFAAFYVLAGIPLARMADRRSRRNLLTACLSIWSLATMLCGMATSFTHLALTRIGVAAGEAGSTPATQSLLADLYPASQRSTVIGIWSASQSIGIALGLFLGGWLNTVFDWRTAFVVVGAPGLILALVLFLTVREPPRGLSDTTRSDQGTSSFRDALGAIVRSPALLMMMLVATTCAFSAYSILGWGPTFFLRVHGLTTMEVGLWMGLGVASGLFTGNVATGYISDRFAKGSLPQYMKVAGCGTVLSGPAGLLFVLSDNTTVSLISLCVSSFLMAFWLPPTYAVALGLSGPHNRGMTTALLTLATSLIGAGLGPLFVGIMSDLFAPAFGKESLRYALLLVLVALVASGLLCFASVRPIRRAVERMKREGA